jgi:hypothetical protein
MRASLLGTVSSWAVFGTVWFRWREPLPIDLALLIAVGFSLLLLAHVLAFTARMLALWRALRSKAPVEVQQVWPGRRVFLRSLI